MIGQPVLSSSSVARKMPPNRTPKPIRAMMPPGISGVEAAREIRSIDESVPILFVSGYSDFALDDLQHAVPPAARMDLIEKPVQLAKLASKIKRLAG